MMAWEPTDEAVQAARVVSGIHPGDADVAAIAALRVDAPKIYAEGYDTGVVHGARAERAFIVAALRDSDRYYEFFERGNVYPGSAEVAADFIESLPPRPEAS